MHINLIDSVIRINMLALLKLDGKLCGGTIITEYVVITAASCLYYENKQRWAQIHEVHVLHGNFSVPGA